MHLSLVESKIKTVYSIFKILLFMSQNFYNLPFLMSQNFYNLPFGTSLFIYFVLISPRLCHFLIKFSLTFPMPSCFVTAPNAKGG